MTTAAKTGAMIARASTRVMPRPQGSAVGWAKARLRAVPTIFSRVRTLNGGHVAGRFASAAFAHPTAAASLSRALASVIAGLDSAIHPFAKTFFKMDGCAGQARA